jgi:hypothetical protein
MKRSVVAAMVLSFVIVVPGFAAESDEPAKGLASPMEQRKAQILQSLDQRITGLQKEKECVKAVKSDEDLNACTKKFGPARGPSGPGGMGRPGRPGGQIPQGGKSPE